ncbi:hypothetical protein BU26DRAFT_575073 [Trematosphaeria pertusa]|uniref:Uncharacterized protein n=1 Tax=Trematosphaeria pertusa TaxID=390896 RepID=A0A6A6J4G5_9PLEO|nr:uncharacterized protein BU26DRAFT_575073 [Trematosphaeria pertusa]KAF2256760.1 hypothetical protein BU26DRAFT_575073 [Trematosphaeria pertusa]
MQPTSSSLPVCKLRRFNADGAVFTLGMDDAAFSLSSNFLKLEDFLTKILQEKVPRKCSESLLRKLINLLKRVSKETKWIEKRHRQAIVAVVFEANQVPEDARKWELHIPTPPGEIKRVLAAPIPKMRYPLVPGFHDAQKKMRKFPPKPKSPVFSRRRSSSTVVGNQPPSLLSRKTNHKQPSVRQVLERRDSTTSWLSAASSSTLKSVRTLIVLPLASLLGVGVHIALAPVKMTDAALRTVGLRSRDSDADSDSEAENEVFYDMHGRIWTEQSALLSEQIFRNDDAD